MGAIEGKQKVIICEMTVIKEEIKEIFFSPTLSMIIPEKVEKMRFG